MTKRKGEAPPQFVIVWEFRPSARNRLEFEAAYGPHGVWAQFFHRGEGYIGTELLLDRENAGRYFTVDVWKSREAYVRFRKENAAEYESIDEQCELLTETETKIGEFNTVGNAESAASPSSAEKRTTLRGCEVRAAQVSDVQAMIALERLAGAAAHWAEAAYKQMFSPDAPPRVALVLIENSRMYGFVIARLTGAECELENIVVDESSQRKGLGALLMESLVSAARERQVKQILLEVRESNAAARGLYERCGFKVTGRRRGYYDDPVEDAVLYARAV